MLCVPFSHVTIPRISKVESNHARRPYHHHPIMLYLHSAISCGVLCFKCELYTFESPSNAATDLGRLLRARRCEPMRRNELLSRRNGGRNATTSPCPSSAPSLYADTEKQKPP